MQSFYTSTIYRVAATLKCVGLFLCASMWFYVVLCGFMWFYVVLCGSMWFYVVLCGSMWFYVLPCASMCFYVLLCAIRWLVSLYSRLHLLTVSVVYPTAHTELSLSVSESAHPRVPHVSQPTSHSMGKVTI